MTWPMTRACQANNLTEISRLIDVGTAGSNVALICGCLTGRSEIVDLAISKGANDFNNGFDYACRGGNKSMVERMIRLGDIRTNYTNGVINAICGGNESIVDWFLPKISWHDRLLNDCFRYACYVGNYPIVVLLISNGANDWNGGLLQANRPAIIELMLLNGATNAKSAFRIRRLADGRPGGDFDLLFDLLTSSAVRRSSVAAVPKIRNVFSKLDSLTAAVRSSFGSRSYPVVLQKLIVDYCLNDETKFMAGWYSDRRSRRRPKIPKIPFSKLYDW